MRLSAMAAGALKELEEPDWRNAFVRGELNNSDGIDSQPGHDSHLDDDLLPGHHLPQSSQTNASMNATSSTSESAEPSMLDPTPDSGDVNTARNAILADARARKAKKKSRILNYWSEEEVSSLRIALEDVGPKWSLIVSRYGDKGTINDSLKARDAMGCFNKASYIKRRLLESGKKVPRYLQDVKVGTGSKTQRSVRSTHSHDSDVDAEENAYHLERRTRRKAKEGLESKVKVKEEEAMVISDDSDDGEGPTEWNELPSSAPKSKSKPKRGARSSTRMPEYNNDPELEELRMIMMTRRREEAEQAFRMREAKLRQTHQR